MADWLFKLMRGTSIPLSSGSPNKREKKKSFLQKCKEKIIARRGNSIGPLGSSRYLLRGDESFLQPIPHHPHPLPTSSSSSSSSLALSSSSSSSSSLPLSSSLSSDKDLSDAKEDMSQIVVLKVDLHCKGCEGKVRKHLSHMEGVRSFDIEFDKKKVTVRGQVTPLSVLSSVSKVKKAELWPIT